MWSMIPQVDSVPAYGQHVQQSDMRLGETYDLRSMTVNAFRISGVRGERGVAHCTFHAIAISDIDWRSFTADYQRSL